ncbi:M1 family aminopeptidase [Pedobacter foliorum]|uniref:M1 family aminopeptidase n=1 Tax=Pedobacter foliorum TaxID=2739058 RepID=UPI0015678C3B|nr:M1 family aminopeptidase [Pedobacter foliorum]NRF40844.1 HEAT repeat domain-containing protein [Pedobacter foliorum]
MKNLFYKSACVGLALVLTSNCVWAQVEKTDDISKTSPYRASATKINALIHTKLDVKFDYSKRHLIGKEWVTLKPYAYATDSLTLDAKGMDIRTIALVNGKNLQTLKYTYDEDQLKIQLGKKFLPGEAYTIFIDYTAKPDELKVKGSAAITDAKGLYFINPDSAVKGKPVQIWTQGETEASSAWFPTIDKPNQKTTAEISITAPAKYVTLSNGKLVSQLKNPNGTRTDTWKMDLPHSPYLFMMAVGDFKIYRDKWKTKEVNYYLEPAYAPYAKQIFGLTPEMIDFYSKTLGIDYPWNKYSQIVVRDYVSGAMENTTATLHGAYVQRTPREMLDENFGQAESTIAHELFHQWFGDYVTAESWSNLTVNESFANYSECLWAEHKYGKDAADAHNYEDMSQYLGSKKDDLKNLVRFHYVDKEEVFDAVSYQKGGRILNMMRNYLGDKVFFKGLNIYLKQNAFKNGEAHQLRLAMEEASGQDMNWFFNQWYFSSGHPKITIDYAWDESTKTQKVTLKQTQPGDPFTLPMAIDVYSGGSKKRYQVTFKDAVQTFTFASTTKPDLVNVDADKVLLAEKEDHKSLAEFAFQYAHAPLFMDRLEAIDAAGKNKKNAEGAKVLLSALNDKYYSLRIQALDSIASDDSELLRSAMPAIQKLAAADPNTTVQAQAISIIGGNKNAADLPLFKKGLESKSYAVQGASLLALALQQPEEALATARVLEKDNKAALTQAIVIIYSKFGTEKEFPFITEKFATMSGQDQIELVPAYVNILGKVSDINALKKGIDLVKGVGLKYKSYGYNEYVTNYLVQLKKQKQSDSASLSYIDSAINELR